MAGGENNPDPTEGSGNFSGSAVTYADGLRHAAPCRGGKAGLKQAREYVRAECVHFSSQIDSFSQTYVDLLLEFLFQLLESNRENNMLNDYRKEQRNNNT